MPRRYGLIGMILAIIFISSISSASISHAYAEGSPRFILTTNADSAAVGSEWKVSVKGLQLEDLYAYEVNLTYDATRLKFHSAESNASGGFTVDPIINGNRILLAHTGVGAVQGLNGDQTLFTLTFTGIAAGTADIGLDQMTLVNVVDSQLHTSEAAIGVKKTVSIVNRSSGNNGGGHSSGGASGGANGPSSTPAPVKMTDDGHGKKTVELPAGATEVKIAMSQIGTDPRTRLEIRNDNLSVELPPEVLLQLKGAVSEEQLNTSTLYFVMNPLPPDDAGKLIDRLQHSHHVGLRLSGNVYEFSLQLITGENQTISLTTFTKPITLRLKVDPSLDAKLVSVYHITKDEALEFMGGTFTNGEISADLHHFSQYAALEYTKVFEDVPHSHWAKKVITELAAKHIVAGTSDMNYEPERMITRAEFTSLLVRALHLTDKGDIRFSDVSESDWFFPEVSIAVKAGMVEGTSETTFEPGTPISREEMVAMLMRTYLIQHKADAIPAGAAFDDEDAVSPWALPYVRNAKGLHLIEGREDNRFIPQGVGTRAEAAQVIYNFLSL